MAHTSAASIVRATLGMIVLGLAIGSARPALAQTPVVQSPMLHHWEFVVSSGRMIQTGAQRNAVKDGNMTAAQVWYALNPTVAIAGTAGWTRSFDLTETSTPKRDIFTYELGAEARTPRLRVHKALTVRTFAGIGVGGQTHNDRGVDLAASHDWSGYGSTGVEVGFGHGVGLRVEARDHVAGSNARNDVAILTGLRLGVR